MMELGNTQSIRVVFYYICFLVLLCAAVSKKTGATRDIKVSLPSAKPCVSKTFPGSQGFVCVCNATYCDTVANYSPVPRDQFVVYTSSNASDRLRQQVFNTSKQSNVTDFGVVFIVNTSLRFQSVLGFGGAFTDAATINIHNLSATAQELLLKSYYSQDGIEYTIGRIPMASCDFSTHEYSYDDHSGDLGLLNFSLAKEDLVFKIPVIKSAMGLSSRPVKLFGSPWSAPGWMKTNGHMNGKGQLIGQPGGKYFKTWAQYFVRFVQEYAKLNVSLWGLTVQNEPMDGLIGNFSFQAMYYNASMERDFVKLDLGPALEAAGFQDLKLMMMDDQSFKLPSWPQIILGDKDSEKYLSGIAIHWYLDRYTPVGLKLSETHSLFPNHFMLYTEACYDSTFYDVHVDLGSWSRGEGYSQSIINVMNHWVTGWVDWNLALNLQGGPNWVQNYVDSPIIVDATQDIFYKQPMYYHLGHFSKFIAPGSVRVGLSVNSEGVDIKNLHSIAFSLPDGSTSVIILNTADVSIPISLHDPAVGYINAQIPARAIQTYLWKP
ncbi:lysosomal acid glucosylceramidase-like [Diadema setosum]|uniref:lysosomal acid glucosylceramidase-like n=1 Tax=Diadema setosum TaxID=31175 RepID=UPI003B3A6FF5